jgi:hypothetical protein
VYEVFFAEAGTVELFALGKRASPLWGILIIARSSGRGELMTRTQSCTLSKALGDTILMATAVILAVAALWWWLE